MFISPVRNTDPALGTESNSTSPKGTGTAQVRPPAADGLPGHPSAPQEPSSPAPRNSKLPGPHGPVAGPGTSSSVTIQDSAEALWSRLASHLGAVQMQDRTPCPVADATQPLLALKSLCAPLSPAQREGVNQQLQAAIGAFAPPDANLDAERLLADKTLLREIVAELTETPDKSLPECLAAKTFKRLCLPDFKMKEDHEVEPSAHHFDSVLALHAAVADNHGALGRTLLWEGACHSVAGPQQAKRANTLKTVMFELKIDALEWEFMDAADSMLMARGLYEGKAPEGDAPRG